MSLFKKFKACEKYREYKVKIILIGVVIILCLFFAHISTPAKYSARFLRKNIPKIIVGEKYKVKDVIDGDTLVVKVDQKLVTIRMLGVDTPETVDPRKPTQCFGLQASDKTKEMLLGYFVAIETDKSQPILDKYGRVLAYIYRNDGLFMNEYLIKEGYAREYTYGKAYQKKKEFEKIEKEASEAKKGLWGFCNAG